MRWKMQSKILTKNFDNVTNLLCPVIGRWGSLRQLLGPCAHSGGGNWQTAEIDFLGQTNGQMDSPCIMISNSLHFYQGPRSYLNNLTTSITLLNEVFSNSRQWYWTDARHTSPFILHTFLSVYSLHVQWLAPIGSSRVLFFFRRRYVTFLMYTCTCTCKGQDIG